MKKLIAMLLCVAMVAAMGVSAFADYPWTNADSSRYFGHLADDDAIIADDARDAADFMGKVVDLWKDYDEFIHNGDHTAEQINDAIVELSDELKALKDADAWGYAKLNPDLFKVTKGDHAEAQKNVTDAAAFKKTASDDAAKYDKMEANALYRENYYAQKAAVDAAKAADKAAKTAAYNKYLASDRTDLDAAVYAVAVANIDAQRALTNAKAAVADAKTDFAQAQQTWKDTVNVKVAEAQAEYYVAVAAAYSDAVSEAVAAIYDALG